MGAAASETAIGLEQRLRLRQGRTQLAGEKVFASAHEAILGAAGADGIRRVPPVGSVEVRTVATARPVAGSGARTVDNLRRVDTCERTPAGQRTASR